MLSLWTEVVAVSEREALGQMARLDNRSGGTGRLLCNRMIILLLELDSNNHHVFRQLRFLHNNFLLTSYLYCQNILSRRMTH